MLRLNSGKENSWMLRNGYELIPHPAYSPDLAPSDFFLVPNFKKNISVDVISGLTKKS